MRFFLPRLRAAQVAWPTLVTACSLAGCSGPSTSNGGSNGSGAASVAGASAAGGSAQGGAAAPGSAGAAVIPAPDGGMSAGGASGNASGGSYATCPADTGMAAPIGDAGLAALPNLATTYEGTFSKPPQQVDTSETTDAPLLGNGDLGVAVVGNIDAMTFVLSKNEFWSLQGAVKAMARLSLSMPSMAGASYSMTEKIAIGQVTGSFVQGGQTVTTTSWVQATDTTNNQFFTEIANAGTSALQVSASVTPGHKNSNPSKSGATADVLYEDVQADSGDMVGGQPTRKVRVAVRAIGAAGTASNGSLTFTVPAGQKVMLATSVMSNLDSAMYTTAGVTGLAALDAGKVDALSKTHQGWWDSFYRKSFVEIQDKNIEKMFYASLYLLACTSRTGEAPPGLWGSWIMTDPAWFGDYTLNYNYEAPFFAAFPTNHVELADSYDKPVTDWLPRAQALAMTHSWKGALYRVHIGPLPNGSADTNDWNQKSMGGWAATVMLMHYYYTLDPAYATAIYPTLKQMSIFWENYLVKNGDKYDIVNDAQHEGDASPQTNGVMSLGLVRFLLQATIDVSTALGMDADERAVWQDKLTHLAPYATFTMSGKTVFRYTEVGRDWNNGNSIGIQHIYPGSQIGLSSDATLLQTGKNMVDVMARWQSGGGNVTFFPAAARVGYDPAVILTQLGNWIKGNTFPNLHIHEGGGGIENFNTVPSTLSEMMLQSFQGTLRIFPTWPSGSDAKFAGLRAYGAFLVSSAIEKDAIPYVRIVSERGGPFTLANPWSDKPMAVFRNGVDAGMQSGQAVTLQTCANDSIFVAPPGTAYATIAAAVNAP